MKTGKKMGLCKKSIPVILKSTGAPRKALLRKGCFTAILGDTKTRKTNGLDMENTKTSIYHYESLKYKTC